MKHIHSQNRRKYKRAVNAEVRKFNESIKNDWLWNGRFVMSQNEAYFRPYEDHSGGEYLVGLVLKDKKTGLEERRSFDNYSIDWRMWEWANRCITEYWNVWAENPNPNAQARLEGRMPPEW